MSSPENDSSPPAVLPVVCFAIGELDGEAELSVRRLFEMLTRHCPQPFRLYCYSDVPRSLPRDVMLRDCSGWTELLRTDMRATTLKLGLFNPRYVEFDAFLYLDLSLVIRSDMGAMLSNAFARPQGLIVVTDWLCGGYNSSVMRIRRGALPEVYQAFAAGERFTQRVPGDQDFIHAVVASRGLQDRVAMFPPHQVVSFRATMKVGRYEPAIARERMANATIVKFHGRPKMTEAFGRRYHWRLRLRELLRGQWRVVMPVDELRREWQGANDGASLAGP